MRDNDRAYGQAFQRRIRAMGIRDRPISPRSPWQNPYAEGHKTSVSLEDEFWNSLKEIAHQRGMTVAALVAAIDGDRQHANLSSAIRLFVLGFYRDQRR